MIQAALTLISFLLLLPIAALGNILRFIFTIIAETIIFSKFFWWGIFILFIILHVLGEEFFPTFITTLFFTLFMTVIFFKFFSDYVEVINDDVKTRYNLLKEPFFLSNIYMDSLPKFFRTVLFTKRALEKCDSSKTSKLFSKIPKKLFSEQLITFGLKKCDSNKIPELFLEIPHELLSEQIITISLEKCDSSKIHELFLEIPHELLSEQIIAIPLKKCDSNN